MKRLFLILSLVLTLSLVGWTAVASAVDPLDEVCKTNSSATVCKENHAGGSNPLFGPDGVLTKITLWLVRIVGVASVFGIVIAGAVLVFSGGEAEKTSQAKRAITYCVIGLLVAFSAQMIVSFVLNKL